MKLRGVFFILAFVLSIAFISAGMGYYDDTSPNLKAPAITTGTININYSTVNTNNSIYWQGYNPQSYNDTYVNPIWAYILTVKQWFYNQTEPAIDYSDYLTIGSLGSGIVWINESNTFAEVNIVCGGLVCNYTAFRVRLVNTSNVVKYCEIPAGNITATDDTHNVFYVDNDCAIQKTTIQTYIQTPISPGGIADFGNVVFEGGNAYNPNGIGLENKRIIKLRKLLLQSTGKHLSIIDGGFDLQQNASGFSFNITSGQYIYLMDIVSTTKKNTEVNNNEVLFHTGAGTWDGQDQTQLNVSTCDTGTGIAPCSNPTRYRRSFIFIIGYNETTDQTQIHQLLPIESKSYTTLASCTDKITNPITYTLPIFYQYSAIPLYAVCARSTDTTWTANSIIDLRGTSGGGGGSSPDISRLTPYSGATANLDMGEFNVTAKWFKGLFNFTTLNNWLHFDGNTLSFNYTRLIGEFFNKTDMNTQYYNKTDMNTQYYNKTEMNTQYYNKSDVDNNMAMSGYGFLSIKGAKYIGISANNLQIGENLVYSVPVGRRALWTTVARGYVPGVSQIYFYTNIQSNGSYWRLGNTAGPAGGATSVITGNAPIVFEAGENLSVNVATADGLNFWTQIIEFDATETHVRGVRYFNFSQGENVMYTIPVGKSATMMGQPFVATQSFAYGSLVGTTTLAVHVINSSDTLKSTNRIQAPGNSGVGTVTQFLTNNAFNPGDKISYNMSTIKQNGSYGWFTLWEI